MTKKINRMKFGRTRQEQPKIKDPILMNMGDSMRKIIKKRPAATNSRNKGSEHPKYAMNKAAGCRQ